MEGFQLSRARDLDLESGHNAYCRASHIDIYLIPTSQMSLKSKKLFVDGWTFETHFIRSTQKSRPNKNAACQIITLLREMTTYTSCSKYSISSSTEIQKPQYFTSDAGTLTKDLIIIIII